MRRTWIWGLLAAVGIALAAPQTALHAQETRHVWIGESRQEDGRVVVPLETDDISRVLAIDMVLVFDSDISTVAEVRKTGLLDGFFMAYHPIGDTLRVGISAAKSNQGSGAFLEVVFATGAATADLEIHEILFNSGNRPVEVTSGPPTDEAPPPPVDFAARVGLETAILTWSAPAADDLAGYTLYRKVEDGAFAQLVTDLTGVSHVDQGLTAGTSYTYYATAVDQAGNESDPSAQAGSVPSTNNVPGPPVPEEAQVADGTVTLTVGNAQPAQGGDVLTYAFQVSSSDQFDDTVELGEGIAEGSGTTSWILTGALVADQEYWWRARAADAFFAGPWSAASSFVAPKNEDPPSGGGGLPPTGGGGLPPTGGGGLPPTGGGDPVDPPPDPEAPAPTTFAARLGAEAAVLSWSASDSDKLASYTLYRQAVNGAFTPVASGLTGTSHVDQGLLLGVPYTYYVKAVDLAGTESDPSPRAGGVPSTDNVPGAPVPTGSRVADGAATLTVNNAQPANPGDALTYTFAVSASESFDETVALGEGVVEGDGTTSWTVAGEPPGREYWWRARAADGFFAGPWSAATLLDVAPPPPADFAARVGLEAAVLSWSASAADDLASYILYRQVDGGVFEALAADLATTSHEDQGLSLGVPYAYYATAVDQAGNESAPSSTADGVPGPDNLPGPPAPVDYQVVNGAVTLTASNARPVDPDDVLTYTFAVSASELFDATAVLGEGVAQGDEVTSWTFAEELTSSQAYWWRVRAADGYFAGAWSTPAFLVVPGAAPGDFDGDGRIYFGDFFLFADAFGTAWGQPAYEITMDLSGDGRVEWDDFSLFADLFGTVYR